jgi:hypothetical protein
MNNAYEIAAAAYLLIGIFLGTIGPAGKNIAKEVDSARGSPGQFDISDNTSQY